MAAVVDYSCMVPGMTMTSCGRQDYKNISIKYVRVQQSKHVRYALQHRV